MSAFGGGSPRRMRAALMIAVASLTGATPALVEAQGTWPSRPIRIVVPFAPGGASDILGRVIAKELSTHLKQTVTGDNRPGAAGTIGADHVAKSPPDGHTLLLSDVSVVMTYPSLYPNLSYSPKDLIPVSNIATFGLFLIAPTNSRFNSVADVLASEKANPGKINMASPGSGSSNHLTLEKMNSVGGMKILHVPYKGTGPSITALLGGQVDLTLASGAASIPLIEAGKVKAIGITSAKRSRLLPQVPTIAEQGFAGFESIAGQGVFAPAGTPREIVNRLNAEITAIVKMPETQDRYNKMGIDPAYDTPEQFAAWLDRESAQWAKVIREAGIKPD